MEPTRPPAGLLPHRRVSGLIEMRSSVIMAYVATQGKSAQQLAQSAADIAIVSAPQTSDFDAFYNAHRNEIGSALAFTLGSKELGEEAVDEAMARAYQRWKTVGTYESPAGWVYRAGLNWGRSWQRSMFRRKRREELVTRSTSPSTELTGVRSELIEALSELSIQQRAVVVLRYYCDWSVGATAEALDISEGTVKSRSARALEQLRGSLGDSIGGGLL